MMLSLEGRNYFYQWDTNQKITSGGFAVGDEIHFYNRKQSMALVTMAYEFEGKVVADVPNCLLESSYPITVYRYVYNKDSGYTLDRQNFEVQQRAKPDHYVYEETELYTFGKLLNEAKNHSDLAVDSAEKAKTSEINAEKSATSSAQSATNAEQSANKAAQSEAEAKKAVEAVKTTVFQVVTLEDVQTKKKYQLSVVNGRLTMTEV